MAETLYFKVNTAGSWANLVSCPPDRAEAVKAACEALATASGTSIAFKVVDVAGKTVAQLNSNPKPGEPHGWYVPFQPCDR